MTEPQYFNFMLRIVNDLIAQRDYWQKRAERLETLANDWQMRANNLEEQRQKDVFHGMKERLDA